MKKLVYLLPTVAALALAGCGDDTAGADTDDGSTGETSGSPTTNDPTVDPTVDPGTTTDETTTDPTVDPDTGGSDSSGDPPPMCDADDECTPDTVVEDCGEFFSCVGCFCVEDDDTPVCPGGFGDGEYADCVTEGNGVCTSESGLTPGCVVDDPAAATVGACFFSGCEDACDCPAAPDPAFDEQVACDDIIGDDAGDCYIDCSSGGCPDGMFCFGGTLCMWGEEQGGIPNYGDCINDDGMCSDGICLVDDTMNATQGICSGNCTDVDGDTDCDAPDTGDAVPDCVAVNDMINACILPCDETTVCPDDTICGAFGFCTHVLPPDAGYDDCASQPDNVCIAGETCVANSSKGSGDTEICAASGCTDPLTDCPDLPETGDAIAACQDIDGEKGDECVLDCSGGATCPDGAVCTDDGFCAYPTPTFTFEEDFEGGVLPKGWTVHDVDGQPTAPQTAFVDAAWIIGDDIDGPNFSAISTSWYVPAGQSDDWIISPAITLGATATLSWNARATDPGFADGYEVYVVPSSVAEFTGFIASGDPTDFLALDEMVVPSAAPAFEIANEEVELQWRSVDLAALAGEEVHVAFRNNSDDLNLLLIDNIWVTE